MGKITEIKGVMANEYGKILKAIEENKPLTINDILVAWRSERDEISRRLTEKLHYLYDKISELQNQLGKSE